MAETSLKEQFKAIVAQATQVRFELSPEDLDGAIRQLIMQVDNLVQSEAGVEAFFDFNRALKNPRSSNENDRKVADFISKVRTESHVPHPSALKTDEALDAAVEALSTRVMNAREGNDKKADRVKPRSHVPPEALSERGGVKHRSDHAGNFAAGGGGSGYEHFSPEKSGVAGEIEFEPAPPPTGDAQAGGAELPTSRRKK